MNYKINKIEEIIISNNLCIKGNTKGLTKSWPKSYIKKFYSKNIFFKKFINKEITLLDINCKNNNQTTLWEKLFKNLTLYNYKMDQVISLKGIFFDLIIINDLRNIENIKNLNLTINLLKKRGIIIVEDVGESIKLIYSIFILFSFKYDVSIKDYRLHGFLRNNCLLIISNYDKNLFIKFIQIIRNILGIGYYTFLEFLLLIINKLSKLI
tara:strand:+ start:278 stop:907 length:630 start_codon:yes stop_codon:yes gene_type:complete